MRLRTLFSANRQIMLRGNSQVDYEVFVDGKQIGHAWDSWSTHLPWKFRLCGEVANKYSDSKLSGLIRQIEAEYAPLDKTVQGEVK